jgi:hypothetical protein
MSSPLPCPKMTSWQRSISHSQYIRSLTPFRDMCQETQYPLYVKCINTFCIHYNRGDSPSICPLGMLSEVPTCIIQRATNRCNVAQEFQQPGDEPTLGRVFHHPFCGWWVDRSIVYKETWHILKKQAKYLVSTLAIKWHICSIQHVISPKRPTWTVK